jgi:RNA polymerase sigma-70 factor, ECF subfamily
MTASTDFTDQTHLFRGELLAYCYRMLGSVDEAEDLVQETYLRAWRSFGRFEGRSSVRTWLYRIATNACLTALERRGRRPLPSGLGGPADDPGIPLAAAPEVPWLQPVPDALLTADGDDPARAVAARAGIRLALVAAQQYLPARQRAMLILRDVLGWPAAEVAALLGTTTTAVNSGLRRARAQLARTLPAEEQTTEPNDPVRRAILDRFTAAFENGDADALAELLRKDALLEMPPLPGWFAGQDTIRDFLATQVLTGPGLYQLVPTAANSQPAFAAYQREPSGTYRAHAILVLDLSPAAITRIVIFLDPALFGRFRLPHLRS